jgi:aryl carrier-like protein
MTLEEWQETAWPKIQGSWNLHQALPSGMNFLILLSSFVGILGNSGQSNYSAGNTYEDAFARWRTLQGEKTISVDVGMVTEEGFLAENRQVMERLSRLNVFRHQSLAEIHAVLDYYCNPQLQIDPPESQLATGFQLPAFILARGGDYPDAFNDPIFRALRQVEGSHKHQQAVNSRTLTFTDAFVSADSSSAGGLVVSEALRMKLNRVLGLPAEQIQLDSGLDSYGVDSLVGLELSNWLSKESGANLVVFELLGGATLRDIGKMVAAKSSMRPESWRDE